ncbi:glycoside hydrolase family 30 beta sandwich domain-containing protein [Mucilaginibacter sp.]|uniref:glycoside hydrolase family 30 protein n=1 Tax=Mucilaginibacter sp. TaxID=1882438 RepID=UPI002605EC85|nr:glycoside hydrolase family 30 beta sandwich domain-containing protein [Mucilaginibacter sp.]MDB4922835.1 glucosylceramidase [Mucilaginibacter sp.]
MSTLYKNAFALLLSVFILNNAFGQQAVHHTGNKTGLKSKKVQFWLTDPSDSTLFKQKASVEFGTVTNQSPTIKINSSQAYQSIDGFGYALTGGSAMLINKMSTGGRAKLLNELFTTNGSSIGVSYLRISVGSSDLDDHVFSYDDLPEGKTDPQLKKFSLAADETNLIPVLKQILAINPKIKILISPWSAPAWMKTNGETRGGHLKSEYYKTYAQYFIRYIKGMRTRGITIDALTIQNEPLNPKNNPSMVMEAPEQADFIANDLGPALAAAKLKTKIILYDHNADRPDYPISILDNKKAAKYVDGSAFHLYGGKIDALSTVHKAHPDKNLYFTEQWVGAPGKLKEELNFHIKEIIIGATRNWSRNVIEWNLASDQNLEPHTPGGCTECLGAITITGDNIIRNPAYYIIAHAAKFVRPGSKRIESNLPANLPNVAFINPDGKMVLIVYNDDKAPQAFNIMYGEKAISSSLNPGAVATYTWGL